MATRLFIVHGSHPSAAVRKALDLKGVDYKLFEFTPPSHALGMRVLFGGRTVPGVRFDDGEKVQGSLAIMQALERRYPDPPLYPSDAEARAAVVEAERWGEATFQPVARRHSSIRSTKRWPPSTGASSTSSGSGGRPGAAGGAGGRERRGGMGVSCSHAVIGTSSCALDALLAAPRCGPLSPGPPGGRPPAPQPAPGSAVR